MPFAESVIDFVRSVPQGTVVSYGQVAAAAGSPRAARQVGGVLRARAESEHLPWWRVINSEGYITIKGHGFHAKELQKQLLEAEGVVVSKDLRVDLQQYRFHSHG